MRTCSVVIPTYNRAESLRPTLESVLSMETPGDVRWDIAVVDNNSSDGTREVVAEVAARAAIPVRWILERRQGRSYALNAGIAATRGAYILTTDDDVRVPPQWLREILWAFEAFEAGCVGGPIAVPREVRIPRWLPSELLAGLAILDLGDEVVRLDASQELFGANMAFRRSAFDAVGPFPTSLGVRGARLFGGEDTVLLRRIMAAGYPVIYNPRARVEHYFSESRLRKRYFRRLALERGISQAAMLPPGGRRVVGVPLFLFRLGLRAMAGWGAAIASGRWTKAFGQQMRLLTACGMVWGTLGRAGSRGTWPR